MANYENTDDLINEVGGAYDDDTAQQITALISDSIAPNLEEGEDVVLNRFDYDPESEQTVEEFFEQVAADTEADVVVIRVPDTPDGQKPQINFDDSSRGDKGRVYIFEDEDGGVIATFNTVDRVIVGTNGDDEFTILGDHNTTVSGGAGNDTIISTGGDDSISGGNGNDSIEAGAGNDSIYAGNGNDSIAAGTGNDSVYGGRGVDTAMFEGNQDDYSVEQDGAITIVTNTATGDVTQLMNTESLAFADGDVAIRQSSEVKALVTLYKQMFSDSDARTDGQADIQGLQYWTDQLDSGLTLGGAVRWMLSGEESGEALVGLDLSTQADRETAVDTLYQEVLGRDVTEGESAFWEGQLAEGTATLESFAQDLVESDEFQGQLTADSASAFMLEDPINEEGYIF